MWKVNLTLRTCLGDLFVTADTISKAELQHMLITDLASILSHPSSATLSVKIGSHNN